MCVSLLSYHATIKNSKKAIISKRLNLVFLFYLMLALQLISAIRMSAVGKPIKSIHSWQNIICRSSDNAAICCMYVCIYGYYMYMYTACNLQNCMRKP